MKRSKPKLPPLPPLLLACQVAWVLDKSQVAVWEKSRRIGASWSTAFKAVDCAMRTNGSDALYIGYSEDMTREFIDDCAMWAKEFHGLIAVAHQTVFVDADAEGNTREIKAFRIDFASGHKILALSSKPRSIRGKQGLVIIDEAAFHDDLAGLLKAALAMLIWGGRVLVLSSHHGEDNPFNLLVKDIRAGKLPYKLHSTSFMDAVREGLYQRVCLRKNIPWTQDGQTAWVADIYAMYRDNAGEELDKIPSAGGGVYIGRTLVERCQDDTIPILRFAQKADFVLNPARLIITQQWVDDFVKPILKGLPGLRTVLGHDFGRSGDLSVTIPLQKHSPTKWRAAFMLECRNVPFDCQALIRNAVMSGLPLLSHSKFDARGNGQSHAEGALQKHGAARVECVMATRAWYAEFFPKYKAAFEDSTIILPGGEDIVADHRRAVLVKGAPTMDDGHDVGSDGFQRHGDSCIAGLLAWAATFAEGAPIEFKALGALRASAGLSDYLPQV